MMRPRQNNRIVLLVGWLTLAIAGGRPVAAASSVDTAADTAADTASDAKIEALVRDLGAGTFATRERASRELARIGIRAKTRLIEAIKDRDAEVRRRARKILLKVLDTDLEVRIEAFAAEPPESDHSHGLPFWGTYRKVVGRDRASRDLFIAMQRAEPVLLETARDHPDRLAETFGLRCTQLRREILLSESSESDDSGARVGSIAALLLLGSDPGLKISDLARGRVYDGQNNFLYRAGFWQAINQGSASASLRRLLVRWITDRSSVLFLQNDLQLALVYNLEEGLPLALEALGDEQISPVFRQIALLLIGKFGGQEHLEAVEPLLEDDSNIGVDRVFRDEKPPVEVRDVALAVLVHLSGQRARDYGFSGLAALDSLPPFQTAELTIPSPSTLYLYLIGRLRFSSTKDRQAALKKWEAWRAIRTDLKMF